MRNYIINNPKATYRDIKRDTKIKVERVYVNMKEAYKDAGVKFPRTLVRFPKEKRREMIINYIKKNPDTSIIDIRKNLKINPLFVFKSIKDAFKTAEVKYPIREKHGALISGVKERARKFEKEIVNLLKRFGEVKYQVKTKKGIADALVKINGEKYVVEIKDYKVDNVGFTEAKQLNKYLNSLNCKKGMLICNFKNIDKFYIDENEIIVLTKEEILRGGIA